MKNHQIDNKKSGRKDMPPRLPKNEQEYLIGSREKKNKAEI